MEKCKKEDCDSTTFDVYKFGNVRYISNENPTNSDPVYGSSMQVCKYCKTIYDNDENIISNK